MPAETQRLSPDERDHLVAYLDGELPAPIRDLMATKLSRSLTARREVESLERSWELLEILPRPQAPEDFLSRTLHEITSADQPRLVRQRLGGRWVQSAAAIGLAAAAVGVAAGLGFVVAAWVIPNPTARLERDLSIARHLDEYRAVGGDLDFLKELDRLPEFNSKSP